MKHISHLIGTKAEFNSIPINARTRIHYKHLHTAEKVQIKANHVFYTFFFMIDIVSRFPFLIIQCI